MEKMIYYVSEKVVEYWSLCAFIITGCTLGTLDNPAVAISDYLNWVYILWAPTFICLSIMKILEIGKIRC